MNKEWDEAATAVARAVVSVMPHMNEHKIKAKVYAYFATEIEYSPSVYSDGNYYYIEDVVEILEKAFDGAEDTDSMTVNSDFRYAFDQLSDAYQYRILERYQHSVIRPGDSPERSQLNRAIRKLTEILNTWNRAHTYEGTGSRTVISNSAATHRINSDANGDNNRRADL